MVLFTHFLQFFVSHSGIFHEIEAEIMAVAAKMILMIHFDDIE